VQGVERLAKKSAALDPRSFIRPYFLGGTRPGSNGRAGIGPVAPFSPRRGLLVFVGVLRWTLADPLGHLGVFPPGDLLVDGLDVDLVPPAIAEVEPVAELVAARAFPGVSRPVRGGDPRRPSPPSPHDQPGQPRRRHCQQRRRPGDRNGPQGRAVRLPLAPCYAQFPLAWMSAQNLRAPALLASRR
jgi:hypothetical protein